MIALTTLKDLEELLKTYSFQLTPSSRMCFDIEALMEYVSNKRGKSGDRTANRNRPDWRAN